jgi:chondroitin 4-sulfotransferase 11
MSVYVTGEKNITFLHIPKTAGTSMIEWLITNKGKSQHDEWDTHPLLSTIHEHRTPNFTFTVVRNPWDRIVSMYFYMRKIAFNPGRKQSSKWLKLNKITQENFPTFQDWLYNINNSIIPNDFWFLGSTCQTTWIDRPVDLIIRYENLEKEFVKIQEVYNTRYPLPHLYKSLHNNYKEYYTDETKHFVEKTFEEDIDTWKYTF